MRRMVCVSLTLISGLSADRAAPEGLPPTDSTGLLGDPSRRSRSRAFARLSV
jgi:hypothetical protein